MLLTEPIVGTIIEKVSINSILSFFCMQIVCKLYAFLFKKAVHNILISAWE